MVNERRALPDDPAYWERLASRIEHSARVRRAVASRSALSWLAERAWIVSSLATSVTIFMISKSRMLTSAVSAREYRKSPMITEIW